MYSPLTQKARRVICLLALLLGALWIATLSSQAVTKSKAKPFRFVLYGDTRDGHETHRKLVALIMAAKPALVLQTGDLVHTGSSESLWKIYDEITGEMRSKIPVYPARGNHDIGGSGYEERVTAPFTSGNKLYYSFDKENCHFVSVDAFSPYKPGTKQYTWLEKDLSKAQKTAQHIFVFFHVAPYSIGSHGSDTVLREALSPLFIKYGVRAVLNGHDHNYYRTQRDGITYIVSGGGGAPLYPCNAEKGKIEGDTCESVHHFIIFDVNGDTVKATVIRENDTKLESFTLKAP